MNDSKRIRITVAARTTRLWETHQPSAMLRVHVAQQTTASGLSQASASSERPLSRRPTRAIPKVFDMKQTRG